MWDSVEGAIVPEIRLRQSGNTTADKEVQLEYLLQH